MQREPNTQYVLSLSYGKDSLACLEAIRVLGLPLDRIVHAEVWATDTIPADLPPMVEFKQKADAIILERYGIAVEHICATDTGNDPHSKLTFEKIFYRVPERRCGERERERERSKTAPVQSSSLIIGSGMVSQEEKCLSANQDSKAVSSTSIYGFPMIHGNWCTSLKTFLIAPANRGLR